MTMTIRQNLNFVDVAELVRRAAEGDRQAWERLVDQYARLIWSMTAEFKLVESDAADVAQTTWLRLLEHINRIEYPDRSAPGWRRPHGTSACAAWRRARGSCSATMTIELDRHVRPRAEIDERLLADERAQAVRDALSRLPAAGSGCSRCSWQIRRFPTPRYRTSSGCLSAASAPPADGAWPGCASYCRPPEPSVSASTHRPPAVSTSGIGSPDLGQQVRHEQQYRVRPARGELGRADHRNVGPRHPQALLGRRGIHHRGQQRRDPRRAWHSSATARDAAP